MATAPQARLLHSSQRRCGLLWRRYLTNFLAETFTQAYVGSNRTFAALLQAMQKKDKIGLGVFLPRKNSTPQLVAILPQVRRCTQDAPISGLAPSSPIGLQLEAYDELGVQETPSGMHLCQMPWADEIRPSHVDSTLGIVQEGRSSAHLDRCSAGTHLLTVGKQTRTRMRRSSTPRGSSNS